jgi:hypothetical protein
VPSLLGWSQPVQRTARSRFIAMSFLGVVYSGGGPTWTGLDLIAEPQVRYLVAEPF